MIYQGPAKRSALVSGMVGSSAEHREMIAAARLPPSIPRQHWRSEGKADATRPLLKDRTNRTGRTSPGQDLPRLKCQARKKAPSGYKKRRSFRAMSCETCVEETAGARPLLCAPQHSLSRFRRRHALTCLGRHCRAVRDGVVCVEHSLVPYEPRTRTKPTPTRSPRASTVSSATSSRGPFALRTTRCRCEWTMRVPPRASEVSCEPREATNRVVTTSRDCRRSSRATMTQNANVRKARLGITPYCKSTRHDTAADPLHHRYPVEKHGASVGVSEAWAIEEAATTPAGRPVSARMVPRVSGCGVAKGSIASFSTV